MHKNHILYFYGWKKTFYRQFDIKKSVTTVTLFFVCEFLIEVIKDSNLLNAPLSADYSEWV